VPVVVKEGVPQICAYCRDPIDGEVVRCGCGLTYHRDCAERANWLCIRAHPISPKPPTTTKPTLPPPAPLQPPPLPPPRPTTRNIPALVLSVAAALALVILVISAILLLPAWVKALIVLVILLVGLLSSLREMNLDQEFGPAGALAGALLIIVAIPYMFLMLMGGLADLFLVLFAIVLAFLLAFYIYSKSR